MLWQSNGCLSTERDGRCLPRAGRSEPAAPARQPQRAERPDAARALLGTGHGPAVREQAPGRARGGQPRHHRPSWPGEAPLPQPGADQRDQRALDQPVRPSTCRRARRPETSTGGHHHGQAVVCLHDLCQDHPRTTLAGSHRPGLHPAILGRDLRLGLAGGLDDGLAAVLGHDRRCRPGRARVRPLPAARLQLAQLHARARRVAGADRRGSRADRGRAAVEGQLRHRAARRAREADRGA